MDTLLQVAASWILPALFFWFLFSLIAMILIEGYQRFRGSRENGLQEVLRNLMGDDLTNDLNRHALVNPLESNKASYISGVLFARAIIDWLLENPKAKAQNRMQDKNDVFMTMQANVERLGERNADFGKVLQAIVGQANLKTEALPGFLSTVEKDLGDWFYEAVRQMTPIYGARLQRLTMVVSLVVALVANFDVINLTVRLWQTSKYAELLELAQKTGQTLQIDMNTITKLPVGWYADDLPTSGPLWIFKIVGLCLGAFFIGLGSQYVYNLSKRQYQPAK